MSFYTLAKYHAKGWRTIVPTRLGFKNGNPEVICNITILQRGTEELVVYTDTDGQLLCSEPRKYSRH